MIPAMDGFLTALFYVYAGLALTAPLLLVPALQLCRRSGEPARKALLVLLPYIGLPLFALALRHTRDRTAAA
jgi:hypothetical protein